MKFISPFGKSVKGFTLIELMVSIAIMGMMTGFLFLNYPDSAVRVSLVNSMQATELLIREAQMRGSAVDSTSASGAVLGGYGVYLEIKDSNTQSEAVLFGDTVGVGTFNSSGLSVGNGLYDKPPVSMIDETSSILSLPTGFSIARFCVGVAPSTQCFSASGQSLTISFTRPSPNPHIYLNDDSGTNYAGACIEIQSKDPNLTGHTRSINVYNSGMISNAVSPCI